ncbi:pyrroline-5-carboxylate reductase [Helicobacter sp. faydin-H20]|uniref:pyrroline-5-carboxylate reductase n=1 Tax=Helicobacter anatolicus TaxID=2905874 RepID=UPI001E471442|nr:pyrroline-5-carboxylate reductase [Helicobacter anatolicus]
MTKQKVLILGYGQMAIAIIKGILQARLYEKYDFEISGRNLQKARDFLQTHNIQTYFNILENSSSIAVADKIVFLCVKPYGLGSFIFSGEAFKVISVMAGVSIQAIREKVQAKTYIRVMPNTAAKYQKSSSAVYCENYSSIPVDVSDENLDLLESFGSVVSVGEEKLIDASIATSGSSPAFVALIAQALIDAGVREGLGRIQSKELVRGMFEGFALLLKHEDPQNIIDAITSPAGTTIEGLSVLEKSGVRGIIIEACHQAVAKTKH